MPGITWYVYKTCLLLYCKGRYSIMINGAQCCIEDGINAEKLCTFAATLPVQAMSCHYCLVLLSDVLHIQSHLRGCWISECICVCMYVCMYVCMFVCVCVCVTDAFLFTS
jgi:hypothetical protein